MRLTRIREAVDHLKNHPELLVNDRWKEQYVITKLVITGLYFLSETIVSYSFRICPEQGCNYYTIQQVNINSHLKHRHKRYVLLVYDIRETQSNYVTTRI